GAMPVPGPAGPARQPLPPPRPATRMPTHPLHGARPGPSSSGRFADSDAPLPARPRRGGNGWPGWLLAIGLGAAVVAVVAVASSGSGPRSGLEASERRTEFVVPTPPPTPPPRDLPAPPERPERPEPTEDTPLVEPTEEAPPPPPPAPQPVLLLADNPIHGGGLRAADTTACQLVGFSPDAAGQEAYYRSAMPCAVDSWSPALEAANLPSTEPSLVVINGPVDTPCGTAQSSYYCSGNQTIYMAAAVHAQQERLGDSPGPYLSVFAHEYGHHVQGLAGIMQAAWDDRYEVGVDSEAGLEISRRMELQASCFGGMLMAAMSRTGVVDIDTAMAALADAANRGDWPQNGSRDHGAPERNGAWMRQGYEINLTFECNTWAVESAQVS
ncbi:neutral zinc metallopeptidase, partial [Actinoalloteichus spitiensis]|uniref:neutral zinc metallopeptidase n=1 Tax=Actinoalloteichus spitiensis TaxID=252394 RepID=UPI001B7FCA58